MKFRLANPSFGAAIADADQAELLETIPGVTLVTMARAAVDDTGRLVETVRHLYRADQYSFEMTLVQR